MALESSLGKSIIITLLGLMARDMKDSGQIITEMDKERSFMLMAQKKKEYGKMMSCKNDANLFNNLIIT